MEMMSEERKEKIKIAILILILIGIVLGGAMLEADRIIQLGL